MARINLRVRVSSRRCGFEALSASQVRKKGMHTRRVGQDCYVLVFPVEVIRLLSFLRLWPACLYLVAVMDVVLIIIVFVFVANGYVKIGEPPIRTECDA